MKQQKSKSQEIAWYGLLLSGIGNSMLATIFIYLVVGDLNTVFGAAGWLVALVLAAFLGISFTLGEYLVHSKDVFDGDSVRVWGTKAAILLLFAGINWGGGYYRAQENVTENRAKAVIGSASNPRYLALLKEKEHLEKNVLDDGKVGNDAAAIQRSAEIDVSLKEIEGDYKSEATGHRESAITRLIVSLALIAVNIVFGICATVYSNATETPQPQKTRNVAQVSPPQIASQPQPVIGFHAQAQPQAQQALSATDREILRLWDSGITNKAEIGRRVGKSRTHVGNVINGNAHVVVRKDGLQQHPARRLTKAERLEILQQMIEEGRSMQEMREAIGVASLETVKKYLMELE